MKFEELLAISPFPLVDLSAPASPRDGFLVSAPAECRKNFSADDRCRQHYDSLKAKSGVVVQCPYGFASCAPHTLEVALTGVVPFPRLGGDAERTRGKRYPNNRVATTALDRAAVGLFQARKRVHDAETDVARKQSVALHEIRKLNRKVKQTAERLCMKESPQDIDAASPELVRILKTSELMSSQFDVLELLANEGLASLPMNTRCELYRIFDKCSRIYQPEGSRDRIIIRAPHGFVPLALVCDKTFPIIPTVLIENAIKHSLPDTRVEVELRPEGDTCVVSVSSVARGDVQLTPVIFGRGVRGTSEVEGSGNGLYLAQLIARQHGTEITLHTTPWGGNRQRVAFAFRLALVPEQGVGVKP